MISTSQPGTLAQLILHLDGLNILCLHATVEWRVEWREGRRSVCMCVVVITVNCLHVCLCVTRLLFIVSQCVEGGRASFGRCFSSGCMCISGLMFM